METLWFPLEGASGTDVDKPEPPVRGVRHHLRAVKHLCSDHVTERLTARDPTKEEAEPLASSKPVMGVPASVHDAAGAVILVMGVALPADLHELRMWVNDAKLDALIDRFESHPLPPKTYMVDGHAEGSMALRGNGNHCDHRVRLTLNTELSVDELIDYYDRADITGVDGDRPITTVWTYQPSKHAIYGNRAVIVELNDSTGAGLGLRCHRAAEVRRRILAPARRISYPLVRTR
ncbi:hypothetical protein [Streptosporangium sp. LJ11]|uniref:hypothetical protein n=1 Tax=Streptosporangium sp. LJ11 TaxID=3436927 RepID=UPI003F7AC0C1